jgi:copper(I)-binding protein
MKDVMSIYIPAGATVELKGGGYHVMFMNVKQQLKVGDHVNLTLQFEHAGNIAVDATVESHAFDE